MVRLDRWYQTSTMTDTVGENTNLEGALADPAGHIPPEFGNSARIAASNQAIKLSDVGTVVGMVAALAVLADKLLSSYGVSSVAIVVIAALAVAICGVLLYLGTRTRAGILAATKRTTAALHWATPWITPVILVIVILHWAGVPLTAATVKLSFSRDQVTTELYNYSGGTAREGASLVVKGHDSFSWSIPGEHEADYSTGDFSYWRPALPALPGGHPPIAAEHNVGGILLFYDQPIDRLRYRWLSFEARATHLEDDTRPACEDGSVGAGLGTTDIGLRLVVDDSKSSNPIGAGTIDRELAIYEIKSLASTSNGPLARSWKEFRVRLADIEMKRPPLRFPAGLDKNTINKLVFYIDGGIAQRCPKAKIWIRDIRFLR